MNRQSDIDKKVNDTLESLNGIRKAEPTPFFYTRLKARLEKEEKNVWEILGSFLARPGVAIAGLLLILGLNAFILFEKYTTTSPGMVQIEQEDENMLTATNSFDYENLEP